MAQTRVVISDKLRPIAEELQSVTGVSSLSDVIALLLTRYGRHLKQSWEIADSSQSTAPNQPSMPEPLLTDYPDPQCEPLDPVIQRIALYVDSF
jgi:hypothetical protein